MAYLLYSSLWLALVVISKHTRWYLPSSMLPVSIQTLPVKVTTSQNLQLYLLLLVVLVLLVPPSISLGRGPDSTFHLPHILSYYLMEQTLSVDTGTLSLSSLW